MRRVALSSYLKQFTSYTLAIIGEKSDISVQPRGVL